MRIGALLQFSAGADGQDAAAGFDGRLESIQRLLGIAGVGRGDDQRLRAMRPGGQAIIAVDDDRELADRGDIGRQQVRADGGAAHAADDDTGNAFAIRQRQLLAQFPGGLQLPGQGVNFAQHVLGVELLEGIEIVEVHIHWHSILYFIGFNRTEGKKCAAWR